MKMGTIQKKTELNDTDNRMLDAVKAVRKLLPKWNVSVVVSDNGAYYVVIYTFLKGEGLTDREEYSKETVEATENLVALLYNDFIEQLLLFFVGDPPPKEEQQGE